MRTMDELESGWVVGMVDGSGSVRSEFLNENNLGMTHEEMFGVSGVVRTGVRWRWNSDKGLTFDFSPSDPTDEERREIVWHLEDRYGLDNVR